MRDDNAMRRDTIVIPFGDKVKKKEYALIPLRGEASFLFPSFSVKEEGIEYEVQRLISLEEWPEEKTDIAEIIHALECVEGVKQHLDEYLMAEGNVSWRPEHVFWNTFQRELQVLFVPDGSGGHINDFWQAWSRNLLQRMISEGWQDEIRIMWIIRLCQRITAGREVLPTQGMEKIWEAPVISEPERDVSIIMEEKQEKRKKRFLSLPR